MTSGLAKISFYWLGSKLQKNAGESTTNRKEKTMPSIQAFHGIRYDLGHVGALSDVIAPPYDVIDEAMQTELYEKHPANACLLYTSPSPRDQRGSRMPSSA